MAIPNFQTMMLPFLQFVADNKEHANEELVGRIAEHFNLTQEERNELLPSGTQKRLSNRVHWVKAHFKMAGLIEAPRRGICKVTPVGIELLKSNPAKIDLHLLDTIPKHAAWCAGTGHSKDGEIFEQQAVSEAPPEEAFEESYRSLKKRLASELLDQIKKCSPAFFERLVVEVLVKMGYGGSIKDAGQAIGKSGDEGIDGIIKEDKLGLDAIYVQAKRWENVVGRPQVQNFVGALHGKGNKGVFITTSNFSREAMDYSKALGNTKVILIDGDALADLMIEYNVGVTRKQVFEIKKIDFDYFVDEE